MNLRMRKTLFLLFIVIQILAGCSNSNSGKRREIIVFHAGSLTVPLRQIKDEYEKRKDPGSIYYLSRQEALFVPERLQS